VVEDEGVAGRAAGRRDEYRVPASASLSTMSKKDLNSPL
jgi:hypothetical protein